jgi:UDP-glucose 4-epimerase
LQIVKIYKKIKKNLKIIFSKRRPGDVAEVYANTKKFKKLLKWKPKYNNINKIIKSAIKWEKKLNSI